MLVRSGIGKVRLIDFDQVTLSSLNVRAGAFARVAGQLTARLQFTVLSDRGTPSQTFQT